MIPRRDRPAAIAASLTLNGIDFVEVASADQRTLHVHFLNRVALRGTVINPRIDGGEVVRSVPVDRIDDGADWSADAEGRPVLTLRAVATGDFSVYTLRLTSPALDDYYDHAAFTFKADCPSDLDCKPQAPECPAPAETPPPIDYLAKDFASFRRALLDFSAQRYPRWRERSEADVAVMFMEALCAVADDLSYTQDRVAAEASLDTATQRRSIVRLARLVDYEPMPAMAATVTLQLDVAGVSVPAGVAVSAPAPDGGAVHFEVGTGLQDATSYLVDPRWNRGAVTPYAWDDSQRRLPCHAIELWVQGWGHGFFPGQRLLIETAGPPGEPPLRQRVQLESAEEETDHLFGDQVTHLRWRQSDALLHERDLDAMVLAGNLVPATQGRRHQETFTIECPDDTPGCLRPPYDRLSRALTQLGPNSTPEQPVPVHLHTLGAGRVAWTPAGQLDGKPVPDIVLTQLPTTAAQVLVPWPWTRRLLDAGPYDPAFTLDPAEFDVDYVGDSADTIRFGDGVFGPVPDGGAVFQVRYRVADGADGNVAADAITAIEPGSGASLLRVTNPFPAAGGADPEPAARVRKLAPQAFRARQFRAVRPEDYVAAAKRLPGVQNAGTVFRWTGSWLTVFTTADPAGREGVTLDLRAQLVDVLNRYRLAGYESYVPAPRYVSLDLAVTVCAAVEAFRGDVKEELLTRLGTGRLADGSPAFFSVDRFTFGTPLERSGLEAAIQAAPGVAGVVSIAIRRRGVKPAFTELSEEPLEVGPDEILRVDNDPNRPGMGSLRVFVEGGR